MAIKNFAELMGIDLKAHISKKPILKKEGGEWKKNRRTGLPKLAILSMAAAPERGREGSLRQCSVWRGPSSVFD